MKFADRVLNHRQTTSLFLLGKRAFARAQQFHASDDLEEAIWIRRECIKACGHRLSEASNKHFKAIESHLAALAGDAAKAYDSAVRDTEEDDARENWLSLIQKALATHSKPMAYADKIAQDKGFPPTERAKAWQLKQVYMTVKSRMTWLTKKKAEEAAGMAGAE